MRAKAKQAKITKKRAKSERCRYIFKEIMAMGLEWEGLRVQFRMLFIQACRSIWKQTKLHAEHFSLLTTKILLTLTLRHAV